MKSTSLLIREIQIKTILRYHQIYKPNKLVRIEQ